MRAWWEEAFGPTAADGPDVDVRWARAVLLGAHGRYAAAEALLRAVRTDSSVPPGLRAHAAVTRASHLRQVGAHDLAARFDGAAARLARPLAGPGPAAGPDTARPVGSAAVPDRGPVPPPDVAGTGDHAAHGDALTGLAADAIGRWDAATAERMLHRAAPWCGVPHGVGCRPAVRWHWVRAETSLLGGDAEGAVRAAGRARDLAGMLGSHRHVLKSRLVHAVARAAAGEEAVADLDAIADEAWDAGLLPLHWPALLAAADCDARIGDTAPPNGRHARSSESDTLSRPAVAQSRRHAAMSTVNVIYLHSDPVARTRMRESAWLPVVGAVP